MFDNNYIKKAYKYDFFIQMDLFAANGLAIKSALHENKKGDLQGKVLNPIANIFFKVRNLFKDDSFLTETQTG